MPSETHASIHAGHITDVALHDETKCRAYELYEQCHAVAGYDPKAMLQAELHRVVYAAAQLELNRRRDRSIHRTMEVRKTPVIAAPTDLVARRCYEARQWNPCD